MPEVLRHKAANRARNLVLAISPAAKKTHYLFLLFESGNDAEAGVDLVEWNVVYITCLNGHSRLRFNVP